MNSSRRSGTSLVEILVVIVVFLVGILAIVQIFPGGFRVLSQTQKNTVATALGRAAIEMLKNHADQLPEEIVPVRYAFNGSLMVIEAEPERFVNDLGPSSSNLDSAGLMRDGGNNVIGSWQFITGANISRRVMGEGRIIPAPRQVGAYYGSLMTLQFAPIVYPGNGTYSPEFSVYGNDMTKRQGDPIADGFGVQPTEFFVDKEDQTDANITLPVNSARTIHYQVQVSAWDSGQGRRRDFVGVDVTVNPSDSGQYTFAGPNVLNTAIEGVEFDSIRVARKFDDVSALASDDWGAGAGVTNPDPYTFKLLSPQLGAVMFNPSGYGYIIRRRNQNRRDPLVGRVSYDVYDWRIIHDEFRMPDTYPSQYRLAIGGLRVTGEQGADGLYNNGIGVKSPDSTATMNNVDLALQDADSGGLFMFQEGTRDPSKTSFTVNKSIGLITFLDYDGNPANGTQLRLLYPGAAAMTTVTVDNRSMRALYMGKDEWAVQVLKPAARYSEAWTRPGIAQFYIGGSTVGDGNLPNRIYFPPADAGRVVSLGEVYYTNTGGFEVGPVQLTAKLQTNAMESGGLCGQMPYIQVSDYFPDFQSFNYGYMSAVKNVKGASVAVRVLWNPDTFTLTGDAPTNMDLLNKWMQGWRRSTVETYLQRSN